MNTLTTSISHNLNCGKVQQVLINIHSLMSDVTMIYK